MARIYTDTNVLRRFGSAFADADLPQDLQDRLVLSPLVVLELASQLGTDGRGEAFAAFRSLRRVHDSAGIGMPLLPWSDDFFRISLFDLPQRENTITPALTNLVLNVLDAATAEHLRDEGIEARSMFEIMKGEADAVFSLLRDSVKSGGWPSEFEHRAKFARCIARRAGFDEEKVDIDFVAKSLNAYYVFGNQRLRAAVGHHNYNIHKHSNDTVDEESLIYLAVPDLHFLTGDTGFRRVMTSSQADRVHIADAARLGDAEYASSVLRHIAQADDKWEAK